MAYLDRRQFAGVLAAAATVGARTLKPIGVQLYTVRSILPDRTLEVLRAVEKIGYREIELSGATLEQLWPSIKQTSLKPISLHLDTGLFTKDQAKLPPILDDLKSRGFRYVVCPYVGKEDRGGADAMRRLGETLSKAGEMSRKVGIQLCYHNHAFEFTPVGNSTLLDLMMEAADPKLLALQLDMMWAQVAGVDPARVLKQYGSRVALMHLKDVSKDVAPRFDEGIPRDSFREVGNGVINVAAVLKAAAQAGVKHYFVEQDQTPGDPIESLRQSYGYLSKLDF